MCQGRASSSQALDESRQWLRDWLRLGLRLWLRLWLRQSGTPHSAVGCDWGCDWGCNWSCNWAWGCEWGCEWGCDDDIQFVPDSALVVFAGVTKVFAIAEGKAIEHRIEPGRRVDGRVEVLGLATSVERVVVSGGSRLATGTPVREATSDAQVGARNETLSADGPSPAGAVALPRTPRPREPDPVSQTPWPDPVSQTP